MKNKKTGILLIMTICTVIFGIPANAATSYLDVSTNDRYSYYTYKDTGADYENLYYVTPTTYKGRLIMGRSRSQNGKYSSHITNISKKADSYSYGSPKSQGGIYYQFYAGPGVGTSSDWHLIGRYTP